GEDVTTPDESRAIAGQYHDVLARVDDEGLDANISVKLTGFGLELDYQLCRENLEAVLGDARARGNFVRIDMEDSTTTDRTLQLYRELHAAGFDSLGVVLQAVSTIAPSTIPHAPAECHCLRQALGSVHFGSAGVAPVPVAPQASRRPALLYPPLVANVTDP